MGQFRTLEGQVALVTGASRGIGRAIAARLATEGAAVAVNYRERADEAAAVVAQIAEAGGRAVALQADIGDAAQAAALVAEAAAQLGPVDILINNAGIFRGGDLADFDFAQMEPMRRTNVDGLVAVTRAVTPGMQARRYGRIVNLTSIAAHGTSMAGTTFYAATKAAVAILTRRFAMDLGPHGITVNAVAPGFILTDMARQSRTGEEAERFNAAVAQKTMMRRVGYPEDIAHAIAFLVSPQAGFVTAQVLTVDGGRMDYVVHP
jgi:3-oxoacyl-[acyl-carrier protein] reductase